VAEADRLSPNKLWGWLDFETSGLDVRNLSVLEFGWTITNSSLEQLTPVRSRLCGFCLDDPSNIMLLTPKSEDWDREVNSEVQRMHTDSGLTEEYRAASIWQIVHSMEILDQLFIDDLFAAGWDGEAQIILAGSGIAAFDRRILQAHSSKLLRLGHYRSADVSVALEVMGARVPKTFEEFDTILGAWGNPDEAHVDFEVDRAHVLHRAAADVAGSLLLARAIRSRVGKRT
jgi:oligoribonuclease (3'-5' exoribonuclease)